MPVQKVQNTDHRLHQEVDLNVLNQHLECHANLVILRRIVVHHHIDIQQDALSTHTKNLLWLDFLEIAFENQGFGVVTQVKDLEIP